MKKIVCFALIFTILINVLGFGFFDIKASAVAPVIEAIIQAITYTAKGALVGSAASVGAQTVQGITEAQQSKILQDTQSLISDISDGNLVSVNYNEDNNQFYFSVSPNVSSDSAEFAQRLVNKLSEYDFHYVDTGMGAEGNSRIPAYFYERIKSDVTNEYLDYIYNKSILEGYSNLGESAYVDLPDYDFDWTGPVLSPSIAIPTSQGFKSNTIGGFSLSRAFINTRLDGYFASEDAARAAGCDSTAFKNSDGSCTGFITLSNMYGCGKYIVYNGKIYYNGQLNHSTSSRTYRMNLTFNESEVSYYNSADGENLAQAGCTTTVGLPCGYYTCVDPNATTNYPLNVVEDDISDETGGGTIAYLPTSAEQGIKNAMAAGILTPDSMLSISPEGDITGADGITIAQLQQMLDDLAEKLDIDIDLSSLEQYLQAIRIACSKSLTAGQLNTALNNVKSGIKDYSGSLGAILTAINGVKGLDQTQADKLTSIEEQTAAIAAAIAAVNEAELEVEKDDAEIDYYSVEHTGLAEAVAFVNEDQLVNQVKGLLNNILDPDKYSSGAPNFEFYYDSDKNGVAETYNAFDLSFLETPLTNANLKDKRHFTQPMTVREFIQYLIIFICYVGFALKVLRKLPSLFSGGESTAQDGLTMQAIESGKTLKSHIKGE